MFGVFSFFNWNIHDLFFQSKTNDDLNWFNYSSSSGRIEYSFVFELILMGILLLIFTINGFIKVNSNKETKAKFTFFEILIVLLIALSLGLLFYYNIEYVTQGINSNSIPTIKLFNSYLSIIAIISLIVVSLTKLIFHFFNRDI